MNGPIASSGAISQSRQQATTGTGVDIVMARPYRGFLSFADLPGRGRMDTDRFDGLTRTVSTVLNRRGLVSALGLAALALPGLTEAKKKKKKIKRNSFGCVDVGKFCKNSGQCCSGICEGKKGKKKCKAHDTGGCQATQDPLCEGASEPCTTSSGADGLCLTTTGHAGYCFDDSDCFPCTKDTDCVPLCGAEAACIFCADGSCEEEGGTACVGVSVDSCVPL